MSSQFKKAASPILVVIAFATVYIVWGSTYFFIRMGEQGGMPPFLLGAIRFIIAGMILMTWCIMKGEKVFVKQDIFNAAVTGLLLLLVGNGIVIWAEQTLPSAMVAIMVSSAPIWFVLLDKPNWGINLKQRSTITGLIIGFIGVIILFSEQLENIFSSSGASKLPWMLLLLLGSVAWSAGSLFSKHRPTTGSASVSTAWQMLVAGFAYIPVSFIHNEYSGLDLGRIEITSWLAIAYLIVFGSIAAYNAYVWLLQVRPATQVSTYAYINPVIAVILGVVFAGEHISFIQLAGLFVILASVLLINLAKYRKERLIELPKLDLVD